MGNYNIDSRTKTDWLKGVVILTVCGNHFLNDYVTRAFSGYANGMISVFFLLSGYGLFHSYVRNKKDSIFLTWGSFYFKRFSRVFPLFWLWCGLYGFKNGIVGFLALDVVNPISPWFVPAIIQCYLFMPLLCYLKRYFSPNVQITVLLLILLVVNVICFWVLDISPVKTVSYRGLFGLHLLIFGFGYILAQIQIIKQKYSALVYFLAGMFVFAVHETTNQGWFVFTGKEYLLPLLFAVFLLLFCSEYLKANFKLPGKQILAFLGAHSYSIYLFHEFGYEQMENMGLFTPHHTGLDGISLWLLTLPLFLFIYAAVERLVNGIFLKKMTSIVIVKNYVRKMIVLFSSSFVK